MVKLLLALLLLAGWGGAARAEGGCIDATATEPRLCPADLPAVRSVRVEQQAQAGVGATDVGVDCKRFVLSPAQARRYFSRALRVDDNRGEHAVDRGPCWASGTLRFADGTSAAWRIEQIGTGTVVRDGSTERITLYCTRCRFRPFAL